MTVSLPPTSALVRVQFTDSFGKTRNVDLTVGEVGLMAGVSEILADGNVVFLDGLACSGNAWIRPDTGIKLGPAFDMTAIVSDTNDLGVRALYVTTSDTPVNVTSASTAGGNGCAGADVAVGPVLPAEKLVGDLHVVFPPPYSLEVQ